MTVPYRPLGIITQIVEQMGLDVTYAFEDLLFISHNAFLLRMGDAGEDVFLYFNVESEESQRGDIQEQLVTLGLEHGIKFIYSGTYTMKPREDEQLDIHFDEHQA